MAEDKPMPDTIAELRAREEEVAREWEWLNDAVNLVARARADRETDNAFRLLQQQAIAVGQRRVELRLRMAELETRRRL
ncbi:MAG: hypothetical protein J0I57_17285 [Hyphomicrobium sp.]|nr:hypothetical protein [Hyphomicrobium sp.]MBN9279366.1 hypothetical protein [Hyphomicrobium sp.]